MYYTNDPHADFLNWDSDNQEWLESLPICEICKQPIQQEKAVYYNDQWCCEECEDEFWENIREDFLESVVE